MSASLDAIIEFLGRPYSVAPALAIIFLIVYGLKGRENQEAPRPPMVPYLLPWIGSTFDIGKDPDAFFKRASSKFGSIFRAKAIGQTMTYVTSPDMISAIYRDPQTFEFTPIRLEMSHKSFGMSFEATYSSFMSNQLLTMHHRGLSPVNITDVLERYTAYALEDIQQAVGQFDATCSPLASFIILPAYTSAAHAFFGRAFDAAKSYQPFRDFDDYFHIVAAGMPQFLMPGPHRAWDKVALMFEEFLHRPHEDCSEFMLSLEDAARDGGWSDRDIARTLSTDLWAMESNATWAGYWVLALGLQRPEGLAPLIAEIDLSRTGWGTANPGKSFESNLHAWLSSASLPLLTSTIQEALRISTSTFSIRRVSVPTVFGGYSFKAGERVICATRAVHLDEEIHPNAREFVPDRYMDNQKKFTKNDVSVPNHSMPFGGGVSRCEGRHFALGELKIFLALLLTFATIDLDPESSARPTYNMQRMGAGVMPPVGDLNVRIHRRENL